MSDSPQSHLNADPNINILQFPDNWPNKNNHCKSTLDTLNIISPDADINFVHAAYNAHHETSFTKLLLSDNPALASKVLLNVLVKKSDDTTSSSVYPRIPLNLSVFVAARMTALISSYVAYNAMQKEIGES